MNEILKMIPTNQLHPFPNNPFKVAENEELQEITDSVKVYGVITPLLLRPRNEGGYEIIAGHRRKTACERAGIEEVPAFVRDMSRDAAIIALVDSNLHREHVLPSEKAFAYKLKLEAIKRQGQRNDLTSRQFVGKLESAGTVGLETNESGRKVQRYIRLTQLIPPLLELVDNGQMAFSPAVELSYLSENEQTVLHKIISSEMVSPSLSQAQRMKKLSAARILEPFMIGEIMKEEKANQKEQIRLKKDSIKDFFPRNYSVQQMEQVIIKLLAEWQRKRQRSRDTR